MAQVKGLPTPIRGEQGFIDSDKGFVRRALARDIAVHEAKQVDKTTHPTQLFSEDLW
jgi:hypothetical protein